MIEAKPVWKQASGDGMACEEEVGEKEKAEKGGVRGKRLRKGLEDWNEIRLGDGNR